MQRDGQVAATWVSLEATDAASVRTRERSGFGRLPQMDWWGTKKAMLDVWARSEWMHG